MAVNDLLLGLDLGTSGTKAVLLTPGGRAVASAAVEYGVDTPRPGWAEQSPETWFQAAAQATHQALKQANVPGDAVAAIGLSGQMHGAVCLDAAGRPLRPAIIWADQRSAAQVERIRRELGPERLGRWTGNPVATGFMLPTWLWLAENEPHIARSTVHLLLPKDELRYRLTGELGAEPSDASSTLLFDPVHRGWSAALLDTLGIDASLLPPLGESAAVAGGLTPTAAEAFGLRAGTPVVFGGSDQSCQAIGHGVVEPGIVSCTIGTGGQLLAPALQPAYDPQLRLHLFCHALPQRWHLEAAILSAGLSLKWLRDQVCGGSYQELADAASQVTPGAEGLHFLPCLVGERTPHMDPDARGGFVGLTLRHGRAHLARAVMEGVVFALRQGLDLMLGLGVPAKQVVASGGASQHPLWLRLQADIFNRPIYRTTTREAAAAGAALLAGVGIGRFTDIPAACREVVHWQETVIEPDARRAGQYAELYQTFCQLYPALTPFFHPHRVSPPEFEIS